MSSSAPGIFGLYNEIYLLQQEGYITHIIDRAHRKRPVAFAELPLIDLAASPRTAAELHLVGSMPHARSAPHDPETIVIAACSYKKASEVLKSTPLGFGRGLAYTLLETQANHAAVLLAVELPAQVRWRVRLATQRQNGARFELSEQTQITLLDCAHWKFREDILEIETGATAETVTFLIESNFAATAVQKHALVVAAGSERMGLEARALLGTGFVSCFVVDPGDPRLLARLQRTVTETGYTALVLVGLSESELGFEAPCAVHALEQSSVATLLSALGLSLPRRVLHAENCEEVGGVALYSALRHGASLRFDSEAAGILELRDAAGAFIERFPLPAYGEVLPPIPIAGTVPLSDQLQELIIAESRVEALLPAQAIGYAMLRACPLTFLPPLPKEHDLSVGAAALELLCDAVVPSTLRMPRADVLTIFTCWMPLHLTPLSGVPGGPQSRRWIDTYEVAHLPLGLASFIVPFLFKSGPPAAPDTPFALIFDPLSASVTTEGEDFATELARALSCPIVLKGADASGPALQKLVETVDTDLIVLITHGEGSVIEDGSGQGIESADIERWSLRGRPLVINNSCSSLTTTGEAFIAAGARAMIATLWPIENRTAVTIARHLSSAIASDAEAHVPAILGEAIRHASLSDSVARSTSAAYVFIGVPDARLAARPVISKEEKLELLTKALLDLFETMRSLLGAHASELAMSLQAATFPALRARFQELVVPGELPRPLPQPFAYVTTLDIDFLLSTLNVEFCLALLQFAPADRRGEILARADASLCRAMTEFMVWDERHAAHAQPPQLAAEFPDEAPSDQPRSPEQWYRMGARLTRGPILPLAAELAAHRQVDRARHWFHIAAMLVTTRSDLGPNGSVSDAALINRIRVGLPQQCRVISSSRGEAEEEITFDLLANTVDKADLANRFGSVCRQLGELRRAADFFRLAEELSQKEDVSANARSNLANTIAATQPSAALALFHDALLLQLELGDFGNAITTVTNLLFQASKIGADVDGTLVKDALGWASRHDLEADRSRDRCRLLAAHSCYLASRGDREAARAAIDEIAQALTSWPQLNAAREVMGLAQWYLERGRRTEAYDEALRVAPLLESAQLSESAQRALALAAHAAQIAYEHRAVSEHLSAFLAASQDLGRLAQRSSIQNEEHAAVLAHIHENTQHIWQQTDQAGDRALAVAAYRALKAWDTNLAAPPWELLLSATHPLNREAVRNEAKSGALRRQGHVYLGPAASYAVELVTSRGSVFDTQRRPSRELYCYVPVQGELQESAGVFALAGCAVFSLRMNEVVRTRERGGAIVVPVQPDLFLYQEEWGSRIFPYRVEIHFGRSGLPVMMDYRARHGPPPIANIVFDDQGCHLCYEPAEPGRTWVGLLRIGYRQAPELTELLGASDSPFRSPTPFAIFQKMMQFVAV